LIREFFLKQLVARFVAILIGLGVPERVSKPSVPEAIEWPQKYNE